MKNKFKTKVKTSSKKEEEETLLPEAKEEVKPKPFEDEATQLLTIMDKWVLLKSTSPSPYKSILEATRKFLEDFKNNKIKVKPKKEIKNLPLPVLQVEEES